MRLLLALFSLISIAIVISCDLRSGTAKEEMDKFSGTPTPSISPLVTPAPSPVDPADIVQVDTTLDGPTLTADGHDQKKAITCNKFNRVMINGSGSMIAINGACRQIMINGDTNQITADATTEFIFNGTGNSVRYARLANGKQPTVAENQSGNVIEKIDFEPTKNGRPQNKGGK